VDVIVSPRAPQFKELQASPNLRGIARPSRQLAFIAWNTLRPPLGDVRVRQALALAMDRQRVIDNLRGGYATLAASPVAPQHWAFDRSLQPIPHSPDSARKLLARAGFSDRDGDGTAENAAGRPLEFTLLIPAGSDFNRDAAEMFRSQFAQVGVRMTARPVDAQLFFATITGKARDFDAALLAFESDVRLSFRDQFHSAAVGTPMQLASYSNAEVDRILDEAVRTVDRQKALPLWHRFQGILRSDQPWTFLWFYPDLILLNRRVEGAEMDIRGAFVNLPRWRLTAEARTAAADSAR
jgi:peptide/nickel transport system substrate-binding protein